MEYKNKAQELSFQSAKYAAEQNKDAWLGLFADDAVVQDPVGISPLDPVGNGHQGKEAISAFYDMTIGAAQVTMDVKASHPAGEECANLIEITTEYPNGLKVVVEVVSVYKANLDGQLESLRAFWDFDVALKQLS